jgi:hypothetical protein
MEVKRFQKAGEFLAKLRRSDPYWHSEKLQDVPWVFRGQSNANWTLIPSA